MDILIISINTQSFTLWKIILDCIVECAFSISIDISLEAIRCINAVVSLKIFQKTKKKFRNKKI